MLALGRRVRGCRGAPHCRLRRARGRGFHARFRAALCGLRAPSPGQRLAPWVLLAAQEDAIIQAIVQEIGEGSLSGHIWWQIAALFPGRSAKQCSERWRNYLSPSLRRGAMTQEEVIMLFRLQARVGNQCVRARRAPRGASRGG